MTDNKEERKHQERIERWKLAEQQQPQAGGGGGGAEAAPPPERSDTAKAIRMSLAGEEGQLERCNTAEAIRMWLAGGGGGVGADMEEAQAARGVRLANFEQPELLQPGARVQLRGLVARPELNGLMGTMVAGPLRGGRHKGARASVTVIGAWGNHATFGHWSVQFGMWRLL